MKCQHCFGVWFSLIVLLPLVIAQVFPSSFDTDPLPLSVNGSLISGNCSNFTNGGSFSRCTDPTSSVLFDGNIPTLTGLDGDMWASQLIILQRQESRLEARVISDFSGTPNFVGVQLVEVLMFNCPEWGIGAQTIRVEAAGQGLTGQVDTTDITSCDSLVRVCIIVSITTSTEITVQFFPAPSNWVHLAEVAFYTIARPCMSGPITTMSTDTLSTTMVTSVDTSTENPSLSSTSTSSTDGEANTSTPPESPAPAGSSSPAGIIAGVVVIVILIAVAIIVVIIILACLRRKQQKQGKTRLDSPPITGNGLRLDKLHKETDMELTGQGTYEAIDDMDTKVGKAGDRHDTGGSVYEDPDRLPAGKPKRNNSRAYEVMDTSRYEKTGEVTQEDTYNVLRDHERRGTMPASGQDTYSQLEEFPERPRAASAANNPMYSTAGKPSRERRSTSPTDVYAVIDQSKKRRKPPPKPNQAVYAEPTAPIVPNKSPALTDYLETKPLSEENDYTNNKDSPSKLATLTRPVVSTGAMNDNTVYASADCASPEQLVQENVYAEPGMAAALPELNPSSNIYEQIYSESSLSPSSFNEGSRPSEVESSEELYHYSSIYTVPVVQVNDKPLEVTSKNIKEVKSLGSGNFGAVVLAKTVGLSCRDLRIGESPDTNVMVLVAVKKLKANANDSTRTLFEKEYLFMSRLNHPNVIRLLGVCKTDTPFIMMEYMEKGDLNQFLQNHERIVTSDSPGLKEITQQKLITICAQIASGMKYLASKNFVHRDLATRNCLVSDKLDVKIADFGMSRNLYDSHYYVIKGQAILPIRWMASECFYGQFSAKTDVWAFGATMWEVFELAKHEPYYQMEDRELVKDACKKQDRTLLSCPASCPEDVYQIMLQCWYFKASERATFEELEQMLLSLQ